MIKRPTLAEGEQDVLMLRCSTKHLSHSNYATMRFEPEALHAANAGLDTARDFMEKVKQEFNWISYGDLWTLGGVAAIQV